MSAAPTIVPIRARKAGFIRDLRSVAVRALRSMSRDVEIVVPALLIPVFMFAVTWGPCKTSLKTYPAWTIGLFSFRWP